jgi:hypothetical protein
MFEHVVVVMHGSSPWVLEEEEGLSGDLTSHSLERQSDRCSQAVRSGDSDDLSSDESKFLNKRNLKKGREWMRRWIIRLLAPFIWRRMEGRRHRGEETVDDEWSYSMLLFRGKGRKVQHPFRKRKEHVRRLLVPRGSVR